MIGFRRCAWVTSSLSVVKLTTPHFGVPKWIAPNIKAVNHLAFGDATERRLP